MGKGNKHVKRLKSEKAKVKLKTNKPNARLSKSSNSTQKDTSFKVKKILIREQLKPRDETEILSTRKLNIKDLLTRLRHYNSTVKGESLKQLKEILIRYPPELLHSELNSLLRGIAALSLDKKRDIRKESLNVLKLILGPMSNEQLTPFYEVLLSYLSCAMTHIDSCIKEDSLYFLDLLVQHCENILAKNIHNVLPNFLSMICRLQGEAKPGKELSMTLNSKNSNIKWRIKVLERLASMFAILVNHTRSIVSIQLNEKAEKTEKYTKFAPVYGSNTIQICKIDFDKDPSAIMNCTERVLSMEEFTKYTDTLMSLMFDIWLEVYPVKKFEDYGETRLSSEASMLLKSIVEIIRSIIDYIDMLDCDEYDAKHTKHWFKNTFHDRYMRNFLSGFPYSKAKQLINEANKQDFCQTKFTEGCLEQNLGLCQIHIWFTALNEHDNKQFSKSTKNHCISVMKYLNGRIENWCANDSYILTQLTTILRTLFLKASPVWYTNHINLSDTLQLIIKVSFRLPKEELQSHLCQIIGDIMLESDLNELHGEKMFKMFVANLPNLLLRPSINDITIRTINQIVLHFKNWILKELIIKRKAIIDNAKKIDIIGSHDDKQSRLMIYNLFYFMDAQIYY